MKRDEPFNVLRDRNSWSESPRAETIAISLIGLAQGAGALGAVGATFVAGATVAVSVGLSLVTSWAVAALTPQPPTPKQSLLVNGRDAAAAQDFIYGEVRKGGTITYYESTRGGSVLHQIITLAGHEVDSIVEVYANDEVLELSDDSYSYNGREGAGWVLNRNWSDKDDGPEMRVLYHTGDQTAITDPFANATTTSLNDTLFMAGDEGSANFGGTGQPTKASFVGTGMAYMYVRYTYNAGVFKNGLPLFSAKIRGRKVYDPRTDTTAWSNNAALCIRDFIAGNYGLNDSQVDDTAFSVAANICDEAVALDAGGTEARYTINGVVRADQAYGDVLQEMTTACAGTLFWGTGKWKLHVGAYTAPVKDFTLDDIRSNISLQTRVNLRDQFNKVQGVFTDAGSDFIPVDYPPIASEVFKAQDNGVEQVLDLNLPFTTSAPAAQRLAKLTLFRGREQMTFTADFGLSAFEVEVGDIISLTMPRYGWDEKEFEVVGWVFGAGDNGALRISLTLRETSEAAFDWNAEESEIISNDSNLTSGVSEVTNLTATGAGRISFDGTFINSILVDWDAAAGATGYDVEWMVNTSIDYDANGGVVEPAEAVTTREQFVYKAYVEILYRQPDGDGFDFYNTGGGASLTEEQVRADLFESSERTSLTFAGTTVRNPTTSYSIVPVLDETVYLIRVRARNDLGDLSAWTAVTFNSLKDGTTPAAPADLALTPSYGAMQLTWSAVTLNDDATAATDIFQYGIYRGLSADPTILIGKVSSTNWSDVGLDDETEYHYRLTAFDYSGNESAFSTSVSATTPAAPSGVPGEDGKSVYTAIVFQRSASAPPAPSGGSFNFGTNTLVPPSGWYLDVPAGSDPVYGTRFLFSIIGDTGSQTAGTWATPFQIAEDGIDGLDGIDGADGLSIFQASIFRRATSAPATPTGGSYNFGTNTLTPPSGWSAAVPAGTDPIYISTTLASVQGVTGIDSSLVWETPRLLSENGTDGDRGAGRWNIDVDAVNYVSGTDGRLPLSSSDAQEAWDKGVFVGTSPGAPVAGDQAWFFKGAASSPSAQSVWIYNGSLWVEQTEVIDGNLLVAGTVTADSVVVGTTSQGLFVNTDTLPDAVYIYQNSTLIYGLYAENLYDPSLTEGAGGVAYFESRGGFTIEVRNTENNFSTDDAAVFAQNSAAGGGAVWLGESGIDGGYGVNVLRGGYYDTSGDGYLPFTGSHEAMILKTDAIEQGDIVCDHAVIARSISDSFTEVKRSSAPNMPCAVGVYKGVRTTGWGGIAAFMDRSATTEKSLESAVNAEGEKVVRERIKVYNLDWSAYEATHHPIHINSVGEGSINVCGENGNIERGDLIVTSSTPGKGMRQSDDVVRSYTVAKAREAVTFSSPSEVKMIACIYMCG